MSKTEWGVKRRCAKCEAPFYDMLRAPILCPKCGATFRPDAPIARRAAAKPSVKGRPTRVPPKSALPTLDSAPEDTQAVRASARDSDQDDLELDDQDEDDEEEEADADDDLILEDSDEDARVDAPKPDPHAR